MRSVLDIFRTEPTELRVLGLSRRPRAIAHERFAIVDPRVLAVSGESHDHRATRLAPSVVRDVHESRW